MKALLHFLLRSLVVCALLLPAAAKAHFTFTLPDSAVVTSHTYAYDNTHRRTQATLQDGSRWDYAYNDRNELTGGVHKWSDDLPVDGRMFGYGYDSIGNRLTETLTLPLGPRTSEYTVNSLNQVVRRTVPGWWTWRG